VEDNPNSEGTVMTPEDEEFERIAREIKRNAEDDDIQDYVKPWAGLTNEEKKEFLYSPMPLAALIETIETRLRQKNT
jgi:hypothetical protein